MTAEEGTPSAQGDGAPGDAAGEAGAPHSGLFAAGHSMVRIGVGTLFLGLDQVHALLGHAVKRGEQVEADVQRAAASLRERGAGAVSGASRRTTATWSSGLASVMNKLPGVSLTYKPPADAVPAAAGDAGQPVAQVSINDSEPPAV